MKKKVIPATNARARKGRRLSDSYQAEATVNEIKRDEEFGDNSCDNGDTCIDGLVLFFLSRQTKRAALANNVHRGGCCVSLPSENGK